MDVKEHTHEEFMELSPLARKIRKRMAELDIRTIKEAETLAGLPKDTLRHLLRGRTATIRGDKLEKLAKALKMSIDELAGSGGKERRVFREIEQIGVPVVVTEDNMIPALSPGDWAIIDKAQKEIRPGVYFIEVAKASTFKRLMPTPDGFVSVINDNLAYPQDKLRPSKIKVIGRVTAVIHRI